MDIATVTQLISGLGFPIAVCLLCFWYINKQEESNRNDIDKLATAINNNTAVIQRLLDKFNNED